LSPLYSLNYSSRKKRDAKSVESELKSLLSRLHCLVVGPGLGREPYMISYAKSAVRLARENGMFLVLDADALYMVGQDLSLIKGYRRAVVTPNVVEFKRLSEQLGVDPKTPEKERATVVSRALGGVAVLQKGANDIISVDTTGQAADLAQSKLDEKQANKESMTETYVVDVEGGKKRCGGQGDVLSGSVGTMLAWGKCYEDGAFG
jgi:ATP-dependent NAD(P)H-hydrate dehydratase